ncbi:MAG TPA: efflux RND transporter permease subunit [Ktedonobacteraceae bacterium]
MVFLSRFSLANRSLIALASITVVLVGFVVLPLLKQDELPPVTYPAIELITAYPGATPEQVEQDVTTPLEENIRGLQQVQQVTSQSSGRLSLITVLYNDGTDLDTAQQKLAAQVRQVQPALPANVTPELQAFNPADLPILLLTVTSTEDVQVLAPALNQYVLPALQGVSGVGAITITGVRQQVVTVNLDLHKLQTYGISLDQVQQALQANNMTIPAGEVTSNDQTFAIRVGNTFNSLQDLENLIVGRAGNPSPGPGQPSSNAGTRQVSLGDIASIKEDLAPASTLTRVNGKPSLGIAITKTADGNTVAISQAIKAQLPDLETKLGHHARITILDDQALAIQASIAGLVREGLLGAGFAILVILLFLLSLRSTLVIAISIPLSVIIALIALWTQGYSLNVMTLAGLIIAVGRIVDDSIVVLENISRHLRNGEPKRTATLSGVQEVAGAITASTLTTVAVFLPLAFLGGFVGEYTHPLALTITFALLASLLIALTVIPVLAYWFLKAPRHVHEQQVSSAKSTLLERGYTPLITWVTTHRMLTVMLAIVLLAGSFGLLPLLPVNAFSSQGATSFSFTLTLPPNTSLARTDLAARQVEGVLAGTHGIQTYQATVGTSAIGSSPTGGTNAATFTVTVKHNVALPTVQHTVQDRLNTLVDIGTLSFQTQINDIVDVTVQAPDEQMLRQATRQVFDAVKQTPNTTDAASDLASAVPFINVQVDPGKASLHGLTALQVGQALQEIYTGNIVTRVVLNGIQQGVELKIATQAFTLQQMQNMLIPGPSGAVRLGDVAAITRVNGPLQITHMDGSRAATITLTVTGQNVGGVIQDVQNRLATLTLPRGATAQLGGTATGANNVLTQLLLALLFAIPIVMIIMVVTFRSVIQPFILLVSIPFAAAGAIVLAVITQTAISDSTLFGFLMLIGIVVTNAIVLIDRVNHFRARGMDARAAVIAGGQQRVRPILMTAVATIMALIPVALGIGGADNAIISSSLAIIVIGGLASSTFLTLLFVPTLYVIVENTRDRLSKKQDTALLETGEQIAIEG